MALTNRKLIPVCFAILFSLNKFHIKTTLIVLAGVVRRCGKEKLSYRKEADMQKEKVEKMKAEGRDECEVRKMNEVA